MITGGVDVIQLRGTGKSMHELSDVAAALHKITSRCSIPLLVNDHAEVARTVGVDGVHVGQDDDSIEVARSKAGRPVLAGKSTRSLEQGRGGHCERADYIGFGAMSAPPTQR